MNNFAQAAQLPPNENKQRFCATAKTQTNIETGYRAATEIQVGRILYIDINSDDDKKLKTSSSIRKIPIHNAIINAGFLEYVESIRQSANIRLFPQLVRSKEGRYTKGYVLFRRAAKISGTSLLQAEFG